AATSWALGACFGDFDGDGDLDLVTTRVTGSVFSMAPAQTLAWRNDGAGVFTDVTATWLPVQTDVAERIVAFDLQHDGDLDLFLGSQNSLNPRNRLLVNDGHGHFTDESGRLPPFASSLRPAGAAAADVDGNGTTDLLFTVGSLRVLLDRGDGVFIDGSA